MEFMGRHVVIEFGGSSFCQNAVPGPFRNLISAISYNLVLNVTTSMCESESKFELEFDGIKSGL